MKRILLLLVIFTASSFAHAVITINAIYGVTSYSVAANTSAPATPGGTTTPAAGSASAAVFGGMAGSDCTNGTTLTCDSCTLNTTCATGTAGEQFPLCACNQKRIYPTLTVTINVTSSTNTAGLVRASAAGVGGAEMAYTTGTATAGSVSFPWSDVCGKLTTDPGGDCHHNGSATITVWIDAGTTTGGTTTAAEQVPITFTLSDPGVDENVYNEPAAQGIGKFTPFPGDDRIYLTDLDSAQGFPGLIYNASTPGAYARVFISDQYIDKSTPQSSLKIADLPITVGTAGATSLESQFIDDVNNGTYYYVRLAVVDKAGNVVQFYPDAAATDTAGTPHPACTQAGPPNPTACPFAVKPDQVLGLLSKDLNCFVATAAYGSPLEPRIQAFRKFRSYILLRTEWGKKFVIAYYQYGPYAARFIADKPWMRAIARGFLWPMYGFSLMALKWGLLKSFIISLILLTTLLALPWWGFRRFANRV